MSLCDVAASVEDYKQAGGPGASLRATNGARLYGKDSGTRNAGRAAK